MILDDIGLSVAAHVAQVVLGGAAVLHVGFLRPHAARADLLLVLEMVHTDLSTDVHDRRLPALDPQVQAMARALTLVRRLPRRHAVRALRAGEIGGRRETPDQPWWDASDVPAPPSTLTAWQEARMAEFRENLQRAVAAYLGGNPLRRLGLSARHRHGPREERILVPVPRTEAPRTEFPHTEVRPAGPPMPVPMPVPPPEPRPEAVQRLQPPEPVTSGHRPTARRRRNDEQDVEIGSVGLGDLIPLPRF